MRLLLFILLFPALTHAQPTSISPAHVTGFIRADLNSDSFVERVVLTLDDEGVIDLYIFPALSNTPLEYIPYFTATQKYPPQLILSSENSFAVVLSATSAFGAHQNTTWISYVNNGYYITGFTHELWPMQVDDQELRCEFDLITNRALISRGRASREHDINTPPLPLGANIPDALIDLCEY